MKQPTGGTEPGVKLSVYVPRHLAQRMRAEAGRQHRSLSFLLCWAWRVAEHHLTAAPPCPRKAYD